MFSTTLQITAAVAAVTITLLAIRAAEAPAVAQAALVHPAEAAEALRPYEDFK